MSEEKILYAAMAAFKQTFIDFCAERESESTKPLCPESIVLMTKRLMAAAQSAGRDGLALYLQQHDIRKPTVDVDGIRYRYKNTMEKTYLTMFGDVVVSRAVYGNNLLGGYVVPLDRQLGLDKDDAATFDVREMILFASSSNTPQDVAILLAKASLCKPSRTAIQDIVNRDGKRIEHHRDRIAQELGSSLSVPQKAHVLVASMDGANVRLREPGVKKGRKAQRPRDEQSCDDSSSSSFRNAMVGCLSWYGRDDQDGPQRLSSTYVARMPQENALTFKVQFERAIRDASAQADQQGVTLKKVFLNDGHRAIWNYAKHTPLFQDFEWCIDFYHTTEHLSKAAEAIFGAKSVRGRKWYDEWRAALKTDAGAPTAIVRSIIGYLKRYKLPKTRRTEALAELTFFKRNKRLMKYASFLDQGYPIGSGPVEAAAKTLVKQRMCRSGMRWNRESGQHILTLRAYVKSQMWERMWGIYQNIRMAA